MKKSLLIGVLALGLTGCATTTKQNHQATITQLQMRVGQLEQEVILKNDEIDGLKYDVERLNAKLEQKKTAVIAQTTPEALNGVRKIESDGIIRISVNPDQVQTALKNAGYYKGAIDNKIGAQTQEAIKKFQKDNGLLADGIIGLKTWAKMAEFL